MATETTRVTHSTPPQIWGTLLEDPDLCQTNRQLIDSLPQFDPAIGSLKKVSVQVDGLITRIHKAENTAPNPVTIKVDGGDGASSPSMLHQLNLLTPAILPSGNSGEYNILEDGVRLDGREDDVAAFDGTVDFMGVSALNVADTAESYNKTRSYLVADPEFNDFMGTSNLLLALDREAKYSINNADEWETTTIHNSTVLVHYFYI